MDMIFDLRASMFQNLKASKHKFSSQFRLCVTWVNHSIPDLSFPTCDFSCLGLCQATILLFVQGLDRMKSIQGILPFFKNICSGLQNGSCCTASTTPRSELFVDFLLLNHSSRKKLRRVRKTATPSFVSKYSRAGHNIYLYFGGRNYKAGKKHSQKGPKQLPSSPFCTPAL